MLVVLENITLRLIMFYIYKFCHIMWSHRVLPLSGENVPVVILTSWQVFRIIIPVNNSSKDFNSNINVTTETPLVSAV